MAMPLSPRRAAATGLPTISETKKSKKHNKEGFLAQTASKTESAKSSPANKKEKDKEKRDSDRDKDAKVRKATSTVRHSILFFSISVI